MNVSVIILNYSRPKYVPYIVSQISKIDEIDQIIISNGKKESSLSNSDFKDFPRSKDLKLLDHCGEMNKEYGLTLRFLSALEAKNDYVMIMDDDIIPSAEMVKILAWKVRQEPDIIHGVYGRDVKDDGYSYENVFGQVPIVLTRCLMTTKSKCQYFMDNFRSYETEQIKKAKPYWNGEDILFSLLSISATGEMNRSYDLPHNNRVFNYLNIGESISVGGVHISYRKELSKNFIQKMKLMDNIKQKTKISKKKYQFTYFAENSSLKAIPFFAGMGMIGYLLILI